jgi:hypothetical protein
VQILDSEPGNAYSSAEDTKRVLSPQTNHAEWGENGADQCIHGEL